MLNGNRLDQQHVRFSFSHRLTAATVEGIQDHDPETGDITDSPSWTMDFSRILTDFLTSSPHTHMYIKT
uniref:Uncharacterized protein n=1 Tax=Knipowitschia caucasica TaxID=637954 RepID=A0AAV2KW92_KNICA